MLPLEASLFCFANFKKAKPFNIQESDGSGEGEESRWSERLLEKGKGKRERDKGLTVSDPRFYYRLRVGFSICPISPFRG
jgi:hypothetical protein